MNRFTALCLLALGVLAACASPEDQKAIQPTPFLREIALGVDTMLDRMTLEEKLGQFVLIQSGQPTTEEVERIRQQVIQGHIGGLSLHGLSFETYLEITDSLRRLAKTPLFFGADQSLLLNAQFSGSVKAPRSMTVAALGNDTLRSKMEQLLIQQARILGINWLMPTPGCQPWSGQVERLNEAGLMTVDRHLREKDLVRPDSNGLHREIIPGLHRSIREGVSGIFLSREILGGPKKGGYLPVMLRRELEFEGLLVSDQVGDPHPERLLLKGVDLFMTSGNPEHLLERLKGAVAQGRLPIEVVDEKVWRILQAKYWMNKRQYARPNSLRKGGPVSLKASLASFSHLDNTLLQSDTAWLRRHFRHPGWDLANEKLYEQSIVLASNAHGLLPLPVQDIRRYYLKEWSRMPLVQFRKYFRKFADFELRNKMIAPDEYEALQIIVLDHHKLDPARDSARIEEIRELGRRGRAILVNFGPADNWRYFDSTLTVIQAYERNDITERLTAQMIFGAVGPRGKLPERVNRSFPAGKGNHFRASRMKYGIPQEVGIAPEKLVGIDAIARTAAEKEAAPGCQVVVVKDGIIIYSKAFGHHTYAGAQPVQENDLYDLASLTKVAATTMGMMRLYDQERVQLNDRLRNYLPLDQQSTIRNISLRKLLIHESGLQAHMPVLTYVFQRGEDNADCNDFFCVQPNDSFAIEVADSFYFNRRFRDSIWRAVQYLEVGNQRRYRYSDVNFYLLQRVLEEQTGQGLDSWLTDEIYQPLGLRKSGFNPRRRFDSLDIVPTQLDKQWRRQLLRGFVHDEAAALQGGVAGNAGLFSTAEELAVIFQMLLNNGAYAGRQIIQPETVELFTSNQHGNHRGLGFDKPSDYNRASRARELSASTFGHTGFTGTCAWADPENQLIYIFLSNRIHPDPENRQIYREEVRRRIHEVIYDALDTYEAGGEVLAGGPLD